MKKIILLIQILIFSCVFAACSSVEDNVIDGEDEAPKAVNIDLKTAGSMEAYLDGRNLNGVESLVLTGEMNVLDFISLSKMPDLKILDMRDVRFVEYIGVTPHLDIEKVYPANAIPHNYMFSADKEVIEPYFSSLETIELPSTVDELGAGAFANCKKLKSIVIPDNVQELGAHTFLGCESLEKAVLPTKYQGNLWGTFYNCKNLKSVNIPVGVREISAYAFGSCENLQTIDLPEIMENDNVFGQLAFSESPFKEIGIPKNITHIGHLAFTNCPNLETIVFHENVKSLGEAAITICPKMKEFRFTAPLEFLHITSIQVGSQLEEVHLRNDIPPVVLEDSCLDETDMAHADMHKANYANCTLYVPKGSKVSYDASEVRFWKVFKAIVEE